MKAVYIEWKDAESIDEWTEVEEVQLVSKTIRTLGWLIKENANYYAVALNNDGENDLFSCIIQIPKVVCLSVMHLPDGLFDAQG